jgi:vesicle coat complex subunit
MQVFILDALSDYTPKDGKEAEETIERVTPRLQHANCAVVLSAVKVRGAVQQTQVSQSRQYTFCMPSHCHLDTGRMISLLQDGRRGAPCFSAASSGTRDV